MKNEIQFVRKSGIFDSKFYSDSYPDVNFDNIDPLEHFCEFGWREGKNPNRFFDVKLYSEKYSNIESFDYNPVVHYLLHGWRKGFNPISEKPILCSRGLNNCSDDKLNGFFKRGAGQSKLHNPPFFEIGTASAKKCINTKLETSKTPLISVLMPVYNTDPEYLYEAVYSVLNQKYKKWELCIQNDCSTRLDTIKALDDISIKDERIRVENSQSNLGIAESTNLALARASGVFVAMMDHDDMLTTNCLSEIANAINKFPCCDAFYTDQICINESGDFSFHHFKPDWSPWMFKGVMYVGHLLVVRKSIATLIRGFDPKFDFVQDYEFLLRVSEHTDKIVHIPRALYQWRQCETSVAGGGKSEINFEKLQTNAVNSHLRRINLPIYAKKSSKHPHRATLEPLVLKNNFSTHIFILPSNISGAAPPNCDLLKHSIDSELHKNYQCTEITTVDLFNSFLLAEMLSEDAADFWVFISRNAQPISENWLVRLLNFAALPGVSAVGPLLLNHDGRVSSGGLAVTPQAISHIMVNFDPGLDGYAGSLSCAREVSALSYECVVIKKEILKLERGIVPEFGIPFNLLDAFYRGRKIGLSTVIFPYIQVGGIESAAQFFEGNRLCHKFWLSHRRSDLYDHDPFFNKNFDYMHCDYTSSFTQF